MSARPWPRRASNSGAGPPAVTMRGATRLAMLGFVALAGYVIVSARQFGVRSDLGPGPGFFPFLLGLLLCGLALLWLLRDALAALRGRPAGEAWPEGAMPRAEAARRLLAVIVLLALAAVGLPRIGFALTGFLLVGLMMPLLEERRPVVVLLAALGAGPGLHALFAGALGVALPPLPFNLGWP